MSSTFDVLVLGAGSGGYACALRAAQLGLTVGLVERDRLGGTCLHEGCIPTKALLHAAEVADTARDASRFGVRASLEGVDLEQVNAYKDRVVTRLHKGLTGLIGSRGITVIEGSGTLTGPREVTVDGTAYTGTNLVLATGSRSRELAVAPFDGGRVLDSTAALAMSTLPESAVVVGGGVIGSEFASIWASFGVKVTIVEALDRLIPGEDAASSAALLRAFKKRKIDVRLGTALSSVRSEGDSVVAELDGSDPVSADICLVAIGRAPVSDGMGFEEQGLAIENGCVVVDELGRTNLDGTWAVGDLVAGLQLAHRGFAHGIAVAERIAGHDSPPIPEHGIPRVTYSHPEVASVGMTEAEGIEAHGEDGITTVTYDLGGNGKSQILATQGFVKLVRQVDGPVLGVHMVGDRVGELIGEAQLICNWDAHPEDVTPLLHAHPTQHEALGEAHLALAGKPLHAHA